MKPPGQSNPSTIDWMDGGEDDDWGDVDGGTWDVSEQLEVYIFISLRPFLSVNPKR